MMYNIFALCYDYMMWCLQAQRLGAAVQAFSSPEWQKIKTTAIIKIRGVLSGGDSPYGFLFGGGTTYQSIIEAAEQISLDASVTRVILDVDSPGGYVTPGLKDAWEALYALRNSRDVIAVNSGTMASGAYWLASAANKIYSVNDLARQGSIGVCITYTDYDEADAKRGIKEVRIVSKNAPLKALPLSDEREQASMQAEVDFTEERFLKHIAKGRGREVADVAKSFGHGAMLLPDEALRCGMIDGFNTVSALINSDSAIKNNKQKVSTMKLSELLAANPEASAEYLLALEKAKADGRNAGVEHERARIAQASLYLHSDSYSDAVKKLAAAVIAGDTPLAALTAVVNYEDQLIALQKSAVPTPPATVSDIHPTPVETFSTDGKIRNLEDLEAAIKAGK